jgi:hypothetical protein
MFNNFFWAKSDNTTVCMQSACWTTMATNTHSNYLILTAFLCNNGYVNTPKCYVTRNIAYLVHHYNLKYSFIFMVTSIWNHYDLQHIRTIHPTIQCHILEEMNLYTAMNGYADVTDVWFIFWCCYQLIKYHRSEI